jgi:hypothetical protein
MFYSSNIVYIYSPSPFVYFLQNRLIMAYVGPKHVANWYIKTYVWVTATIPSLVVLQTGCSTSRWPHFTYQWLSFHHPSPTKFSQTVTTLSWPSVRTRQMYLKTMGDVQLSQTFQTTSASCYVKWHIGHSSKTKMNATWCVRKGWQNTIKSEDKNRLWGKGP